MGTVSPIASTWYDCVAIISCETLCSILNSTKINVVGASLEPTERQFGDDYVTLLVHLMLDLHEFQGILERIICYCLFV